MIFSNFIFASRILILLLCTFTSTSGKKNYLRSFESLGVLALTEKSIYDSLKEFSLNSESNYEITRYLEDYDDSSGRFVKDPDFISTIAGNPILSSKMLHRYAIQLKLVLDKKTKKLQDILHSILKHVEDSVGLPNISDVDDIWKAIIRIIHVYDLSVHEFAKGMIQGTPTGAAFRAKDCVEIGEFAVKFRYFSQAIEWLEFAGILITEENDWTIPYQKVKESFTIAYMEHDKEWDITEMYDNKFFMEKLATYNAWGWGSEFRLSRRKFQYEYWKGRREINFNVINFWGLCSGEDLRTDEEKSKLFCWYDSQSHPAWYINPLKIEQHSISPYVIQFYDVFGEKISNKLIELSHESLSKSSDIAPNGVHNDVRTSAHTWLNDTDIPELNFIPKKIELMTKLAVFSSNASEMLQIASNSLGGHYEVHVDVSRDQDNEFNLLYGPRMATFMIYLTDVEKGGYTAFAQAGIAARPIRGSAVFWYNLKQNGEIDELTHHGGCPVILGRKWVANKWIRSHSQFLTRPCSLDPDE